ncbi:MAG: VOC family protein [Chloroflexia bacterium]
MSEVLTWFEIPSTDFDRAVGFYNKVLNTNLRTGEFMGVPHGFFTDDTGDSRGAVIHRGDSTPGANGPLIYIYLANEVSEVLARVGEAGGTIVQPETSLGPQGTMAVILDSEGNRVGLHRP